MRTYAAIVRDHSASMRSITRGAMSDYNLSLDGLKESEDGTQFIHLTVVECGMGHMAKVGVSETMKPVRQVKPLSSYIANGSGTPLWDSVGRAIEEIEANVDYYARLDPTTAYLVMVITDGAENASRNYNARSIADKMRALQNTDKWTFVFRVPRGDKAALVRMGIPEGNIMEWEQSDRGYQAATTQHTASTKAFFASRAAGKTATNAFYVDASNLNVAEVKAALVDISGDVYTGYVDSAHAGMMIRDFCERRFGVVYKPGQALYQLTKREEVQDYKKFAVREKKTGKLYTGPAARQLLGLPSYGTIKVVPSAGGPYDIFVQSNSVNRKLMTDTSVLYFK